MCEADLHPRCGKLIQSLQNFHQFRLLESVSKARKPAELVNETRLDAPLVAIFQELCFYESGFSLALCLSLILA